MWTPKQGNVLYLDWESTHRDHLRRAWAVKRGLGIDNYEEFLYLSCGQPLSVMLPRIQEIVEKHNIKLLIVDSQMAGSDFGPDIGQNATRFYNALRMLGCSTLVLDHVSKAAMQMPDDANSTGPHGSVVKANRSRQQYELKKHQAGQGFTDLTLRHWKNNEGPLAEAQGIKIAWVNDQNGHLDRVIFTSLEVDKHPIASTSLPLWRRLSDALGGEAMTLTELCELMPDKTEGTIRATLYQYKDKFVRVGSDRWGRLAAERA